MGEQARYQDWMVQRARLATERLAQRVPAVARVLAASSGTGWLVAWLPLIAFTLGLAADAAGSAQRINLLAPPFLALIVWNLAIYAALAWAALRARLSDRARRPAPGPLRRALAQAVQRVAHSRGEQGSSDGTAPALHRFLSDWTRQGEALHRARLATILHLASAALTAGMLSSLYVRGLAFEYRAGWDSTFLTPQSLHQLLSLVWGPASYLTGLSLPSSQQIADLRFSAGPGENAARWIHLMALSVSLLVLLPRLALAGAAAWRTRQLTQHFPLPLDDAYFRRLRPAHGGRQVPVLVLPYSYQLPPSALAGLEAVLQAGLGSNMALQVAKPIALGAEDELGRWLPPLITAQDPTAIVVLFALTATPERESHGALLEALVALKTGAPLTAVLIDESGFRQRFTGAEGQTRLLQRRASWQRLLQDLGQTPVFVDLSDPDLAATQTELQRLPLPSP